MADNRSPWRALRPVLLAGAATLTWLTFSTSTASADTLPDTTTLLGGVTNSVSAVTEKLPVPVAPAHAAPTPAPVSSPGLLTPLVGEVSGVADQIVSTVPVVNHVVPAGAVSVISIPIAHVADAATAEVAEAVIPPVAEALPVLEPVLQPVSGLVTGSAPLHVDLPGLPLVGGELDGPATASVPAGSDAAPGEAIPTANASAVPLVAAASGAEPGDAALPEASAASWAYIAGPDTAREQPTAGPSPAPALAPAVPASGTGSSAPSAGSSGATAWLSAFNFDPASPGAVSAGDITEHAPAPVSFDPGSRPD
jgi:hypothetical protein